ncbi:MAG: hypothetical protein NTW96_00460 [Planctomycetia bacterium]|nr:hypothetical protein [Planctomycetia bacterium]
MPKQQVELSQQGVGSDGKLALDEVVGPRQFQRGLFFDHALHGQNLALLGLVQAKDAGLEDGQPQGLDCRHGVGDAVVHAGDGEFVGGDDGRQFVGRFHVIFLR